MSRLVLNKNYSTNSRITLLENWDILSEEAKFADTFNEFFSNVVKKISIEKDDNLLTDVIEETDPVLKTIKKIQKSSKYFAKKISYFKHPKVFLFK